MLRALRSPSSMSGRGGILARPVSPTSAEEAELACAAVPGVTDVDVAISLRPGPGDGDLQQAVSAALGRSARLDRFEISVDSPLPGIVVLSGTVTSWAERDDAVAMAWCAPGVTDVYDRIAVST